MRLLLLLGLSIAMVACRFVPNDPVLVFCDGTSDCPKGYFCQSRLGVCMRSDGADREAPRIDQVSLSPPYVKRGSTVTVKLRSTEALLSPPAVRMIQGGRNRELEATPIDGDYQVTYQTTADDLEGQVTFIADLIDLQGNETLGQVLGLVTFDFTPPSVLNVTNLASGGTADAGIFARPIDRVAVRLAFSEAIVSGLSLTEQALDCSASPLEWLARDQERGLIDFERPPRLGTGDCSFSLHVANVFDLAGNVMQPMRVELVQRLFIDGVAPVIEGLALTRETLDAGWLPAQRFSQQPGFSTMGVRFRVPNDVHRVVARFDELELDCGTSHCLATDGERLLCHCQRPIGVKDSEGAHLVSLEASDVAGNVSSASVPLTIDRTPPAVIGASLSLTTATTNPLRAATSLTTGTTARLAFTVSEPLGATPQVTLMPAGLGFSLESEALTNFVHVLTPAVSIANGVHRPTVTVRDAVDNATTTSLMNVTFDSLPPPAPSTALDGGVVYLRAPWGARGGQAQFELVAPRGAASPEAVAVRVLDPSGAELARSAAVDGGALRIGLPLADRAVIFVTAVDAAGNESVPVDVKNVVWTASFGGKQSGSLFENPHTAELRPEFGRVPDQPGAVELNTYQPLLSTTGAARASAVREWVDRGVGSPLPRYFSAMAYDSIRDRVVVFGGSDQFQDFADLHEWNGTSWTLRRPPGRTPSARSSAAMAYDAARGVTVMFGGLDSVQVYDELWEWNGSVWTQRSAAGVWPSPRVRAAVAYDSLRERVVVFGGFDAHWNELAETWEWDGASWTRRTGAQPPARNAGTMGFDHVRGVTVLFGGERAGTPLGDTWELNATGWVRRMPTGSPAARLDHVGFFDGQRQRFVVFGGRDNTVAFTDTWEYDGARWVRKTGTGGPPERLSASAAYDSARQRGIVFGGSGSVDIERSTLSWNGTVWADVTPSAPVPESRASHAMAFDAARNRVVLFGGSSTQASYGETWEWDGLVWRNRAPANAPSARGQMTMAYDATSSRTVLFGGYDSQPRGDHWTWNGTNWVRRTGTAPSARWGAAMAYDPVLRVLSMSGGVLSSGSLSDEMWNWNGMNWVSATRLPGERSGHLMAYDPGRSTMVVAGIDEAAAPDLAFTIHELNGSQWRAKNPAERPTLTVGAQFVYEPDVGELILHGGTNGSHTAVSNQTWSWNGARWLRHTGSVEPQRRYGHGMVYDSTRRRLVVFGGTDELGNSVDQLTEWAVEPSGRPAVVARFALSAIGDSTVTLQNVTASWWASGLSRSTNGARLWVGGRGSFFAQGANAAARGSNAELRWSTVDPSVMASLPQGSRRDVLLAVTPVVDNQTERGVVEAGAVELQVTYRRQ